jgi:rhodanese-related sulfurtransferase
MKSRYLRKLALLPALALVVALAACSSSSGSSKTDFEVVQEAVQTWLASGTAGAVPAAAIAPVTVYDDLQLATPTYYVLSVRSQAHYELGHIPGAHRIDWRNVSQTANLATLPTDQKIVVYCYTGHTGGLAAAALGILGFDTVNLKWGMMNWSDDPTVVATTVWDASQCLDADTETTAHTLGTTVYDLPDLEVSSSSDEATIVQAAAARWLEDATWTPIIAAQAVFDELNDGDSTDDPIIISVRSAAHYATGHVPGAINIALADLADTEVLNKLDPEKDIVVYCYTGHTGGQATVVLNMLGYKAKNMKFGMMAWTSVAGVLNTTPFSAAPGYATTAGATPNY